MPSNATEDEVTAWPLALSDYIRSSDEQLLAATPKLLAYFEGDLSPIESVAEFLDVMGRLTVARQINSLTR